MRNKVDFDPKKFIKDQYGNLIPRNCMSCTKLPKCSSKVDIDFDSEYPCADYEGIVYNFVKTNDEDV